MLRFCPAGLAGCALALSVAVGEPLAAAENQLALSTRVVSAPGRSIFGRSISGPSPPGPSAHGFSTSVASSGGQSLAAADGPPDEPRSSLQLTMPVLGNGGLIPLQGVSKRAGSPVSAGRLQPAIVSLQLPTPLPLASTQLTATSLVAPARMTAALTVNAPGKADFRSGTATIRTFRELDVSGDLNGDGVVDHIDYGAWRNSAVDRFMLSMPAN